MIKIVFPGDIPGAGANFGLPSYQSQRPSDGETNARPNQSETSSQLGFSAGNSIAGDSAGSRPSIGGGSTGLRPSFGGGSSGSRPSVGGGSSGSRPSFVGGSAGSRPSQETSEAIEPTNFGFPESLGKAGRDFPIYDRMNMPITSFTCQDKENGGYVGNWDGC